MAEDGKSDTIATPAGCVVGAIPGVIQHEPDDSLALLDRPSSPPSRPPSAGDAPLVRGSEVGVFPGVTIWMIPASPASGGACQETQSWRGCG
jgi:hypothetical protein